MNESTWYDEGILGAKIGVQQYVNGLKKECEPSTSQGSAITNIAEHGA